MIRKQEILSTDYWRERQVSLQNGHGKGSTITTAFQLLKSVLRPSDRGIRILELGCGEGHILGELFKLCHEDGLPIDECVGIDVQAGALRKARRLYPQIRFLVGDYANESLDVAPFDLVMLIGTLHEVYSSKYSHTGTGIDDSLGRRAVAAALNRTKQLIRENGYLVLFDGLEHSISPRHRITIRFENVAATEEFKKFANEYEAFKIVYDVIEPDRRISLSIRDFTRYITKTRFINTNLWAIEKRESYQYFNEDEVKGSFADLGLEVLDVQCSSPHLLDWQKRVVIETSGVTFPKEHILIVGRR